MAVTGLGNATGIAAGQVHTCAVLANGTAKCWGSNAAGQLGNLAAVPGSSSPVLVSSIGAVTAVAAGAGHSCALLANGTAKCWGAGSVGQLGRGSATGSGTS